jgi:hypothetical protein
MTRTLVHGIVSYIFPLSYHHGRDPTLGLLITNLFQNNVKICQSQLINQNCTSFSAETLQTAPRVTAIPRAAMIVLDFQVLGLDHQPPEGDLDTIKSKMCKRYSFYCYNLPNVFRIRITTDSTLFQ